jgi:hypothetical protein
VKEKKNLTEQNRKKKGERETSEKGWLDKLIML